MNESSQHFASDLAKSLVARNKLFSLATNQAVKVQAKQGENAIASLDLTPFNAKTAPITAYPFFANVKNSSQLIMAYQTAKESCTFEEDLAGATENISDYATEFQHDILQSANDLACYQIQLIANFVKNLDTYCAIKSVESLLNSKADIALLEVAAQKGWNVHFDHLAIRCASDQTADSKKISQLLINEHGYTASQVDEEIHYQFPDGWNAYPVYKMLENGQTLRVFVDQSDVDDKHQIIQHWNHIYGYTAHHLAMRATRTVNQQKEDIPLDEVIQALTEHGISILSPTGAYTDGLLLQVFTRPERNQSIPVELIRKLQKLGNNLDRIIENGKLLEVVSRTEMRVEYAIRFYALYDIKYDATNPLHSVPVYTYFLPTQAAHVIKTSQEIG